MPGCLRSRIALFQFSDANDVSNTRVRGLPFSSSTGFPSASASGTWSGMWSRVSAACSRT